MEHTEKRLQGTTLYEGKILTLCRDTVELEDGTTTLREVVQHSGGVGVLAVDENGNILLVRQFRYPTGQCLWEIPAGKRSPGENPEACGRRELAEETGYAAAEFTLLTTLYPTPAYCTEKIYVYLARKLTPCAAQLDEGEFLTVAALPPAQVRQMLLAGEITDAKSQIALLRYFLGDGLPPAR